MFKNTIIAAAALAASAIAFNPGTAEAGSNVQVHVGVGVPYYAPGYQYRAPVHAYGYKAPVHYRAPAYSYGYQAPTHYRAPSAYGHYSYAPRRHYRGIGCRRAANVLRSHGFHHIRSSDCRGYRYGFKASRYGKRYYITVSARTGRIIGKARF